MEGAASDEEAVTEKLELGELEEEEEAGSKPPEGRPQLRTCPFYLAGFCKYGEACKYAHTRQDRPVRFDTRKARLCTSAIRRRPCVSKACPFAHSYKEVHRCINRFGGLTPQRAPTSLAGPSDSGATGSDEAPTELSNAMPLLEETSEEALRGVSPVGTTPANEPRNSASSSSSSSSSGNIAVLAAPTALGQAFSSPPPDDSGDTSGRAAGSSDFASTSPHQANHTSYVSSDFACGDAGPADRHVTSPFCLSEVDPSIMPEPPDQPPIPRLGIFRAKLEPPPTNSLEAPPDPMQECLQAALQLDRNLFEPPAVIKAPNERWR